MQVAIGIILIIAAIFLIVAVLMQNGKDHNLSGTIAGGAETFFGKTKGSTLDKKLSKLTSIVAVVFCVLVLVSYLMQDTTDYSSLLSSAVLDSTNVESVTGEDADVDADADAEPTDDATDEDAGDADADDADAGDAE